MMPVHMTEEEERTIKDGVRIHIGDNETVIKGVWVKAASGRGRIVAENANEIIKWSEPFGYKEEAIQYVRLLVNRSASNTLLDFLD